MVTVFDVISLIFIILALGFIITAFVFRGLKKRTLANTFEMIASICLVVYSAKFAYLFGTNLSFEVSEWAGILFFLFSIALAIYKIIFFVRYK